jgi:ERCC4-type nuclease
MKKSIKNDELEIIVDDRESHNIRTNAVFLSKDPQFKFDISFQRLKVGDMVCKSKTLIGTSCIEIKRVTENTNDFIDSVLDGRVFEQAMNMKKNYDNCVFILVGDMYKIFRKSKFNVMSFYGSLGALETKYGCSIFQVPDEFGAVALAFYIFKHSNLQARITPIKPIQITKEEREISSLCCIEGIGRTIAKEVLMRYSIGQVAKIKDYKKFLEIPRMGEKRAKAIVEFFND